MARPRLELQAALEEMVGENHVYFQPPPDIVMNYPCIVYARDRTLVKRADNLPYGWAQGYQVTYIDTEPDSDVYNMLVEYPYSEFNRHFATSGLNHDVFVIYH